LGSLFSGWACAHPENNLGGQCPPWISLFGNSSGEICLTCVYTQKLNKIFHNTIGLSNNKIRLTIKKRENIFVLHSDIWVGNYSFLPTQNIKSRLGKVWGGKQKNIGAAAPIQILPTLFRKRAGAHACIFCTNVSCTNWVKKYKLSQILQIGQTCTNVCIYLSIHDRIIHMQ